MHEGKIIITEVMLYSLYILYEVFGVVWKFEKFHKSNKKDLSTSVSAARQKIKNHYSSFDSANCSRKDINIPYVSSKVELPLKVWNLITSLTPTYIVNYGHQDGGIHANQLDKDIIVNKKLWYLNTNSASNTAHTLFLKKVI